MKLINGLHAREKEHRATSGTENIKYLINQSLHRDLNIEVFVYPYNCLMLHARLLYYDIYNKIFLPNLECIKLK